LVRWVNACKAFSVLINHLDLPNIAGKELRPRVISRKPGGISRSLKSYPETSWFREAVLQRMVGKRRGSSKKKPLKEELAQRR
jgi:hypothetical protein